MSLIAWYPLNGDIKDYSSNAYNLTNNGATNNASGKIGSCYEFDKTLSANMTCENLNCSNMQNEFTVSAWFYSTQASDYATIVSLGKSAITIDCQNGSTVRAFVYTTGTGAAKIVSTSITKGKWTHVAFKLQNQNLYLYVNGVLKSETTVTEVPRINNTDKIYLGARDYDTPNYFQGYLNDIRIYNEALTAKQIKEIAQAKICHYSLNENIQPIKNLCKQYPIRQVITNNSTYTGTTFGKDEIGEYFIKQSTSYTWDGIGIRYIPIKTGVYYTVSFEIWCEKSFDLKYDYNISCDNISGNDAPRAEALNLLGTSYDTPKRWKKFAMRSKAKDDTVNPRLHDDITGYFPNNANMVGTKVYFRNVMVEEKDREASYVEDSKSVILKNIDGYKDLSITSTQTYRFPKYEGDSLKFLPYSYVTTDFKLSTYNLGNSSSQLTTASWIKPTAVSATNSYGLIYGRADYQGFGLYFSYQDSSNIRVCTYHRLSNGMNTTASKLIKINEWSHVACVLDNTTSIIKMYINGEKVAEGPASTGDFTSNNNTFLLGGVHYPSGNGPWANFEGYIKDFRMYTTALSDSDIKQLYKPETNIDKANVIRCSEINEEKIENKNGFSKDASITYNEFNEIPNIESGVHNLRLGNEILPVLVDMDNDGGRWARVFYHNCKSGTVLFSSENSFAEAKETNTNAPTTSDKYSILSKLESFRPNTNSSFEFRLKYPTDTNSSNIWKQTSNPTYEKIAGYTPVKINWTSNYWGGLEWTNGSTTLIDGSVNHNNWYYAIGAASKHGDGIPSSNDITGSTPNDVELWVRINNYDLFADNLIDNVSISRNGVLTAKEFREI